MQAGARIIELVVAGGVSAALGALATLATIRVRIIRLEDRVTVDERALERLESEIRTELKQIHRRQEVSLRLMADVARSVGVDRRGVDDTLVRFLTDKEE